MRLTLTNDQGVLLSTLRISAESFQVEVSRDPHGVLAGLSPGLPITEKGTDHA